MMRTRTWLLLSGTLGAHLFGVASGADPDSWWGDVGRTVSGFMLLTAVRHPRLSDEGPRDQQVVVHDVEPAGRVRVLALLGNHDARSDGELDRDEVAEPWTVLSGLTQRRADQVVAYLEDFGVRAERADDPRARLHRWVLRAMPVVLGFGLLLANGTLLDLSVLPAGLRDVALVGAWLAATAIAYVVVDLVVAGRPSRPSDWGQELEVTGPSDVEPEIP